MAGFHDDDDAPVPDSRQSLAKSQLRRRRLRARAPRPDTMSPPDQLAARHSLFSRAARVRRRSSAARAAAGDDSSDSESEAPKAPKSQAAPTRLQQPPPAGLQQQATTTARPQRITPTPVVAAPVVTTQPDRVAAVDEATSSPAVSSTSTLSSATSSSTTTTTSSSSSSSSSETQPSQTPQAMEAQESPVLSLPGAGVIKEGGRPGGDDNKDLRAGRLSQGAEAGIVIGTLAIIALLTLGIYLYRRQRSKNRIPIAVMSEQSPSRSISRPHAQSPFVPVAASQSARSSPWQSSQRDESEAERGVVHQATPPPQVLGIYEQDETEEWKAENSDQGQEARPAHWI